MAPRRSRAMGASRSGKSDWEGPVARARLHRGADGRPDALTRERAVVIAASGTAAGARNAVAAVGGRAANLPVGGSRCRSSREPPPQPSSWTPLLCLPSVFASVSPYPALLTVTTIASHWCRWLSTRPVKNDFITQQVLPRPAASGRVWNPKIPAEIRIKKGRVLDPRRASRRLHVRLGWFAGPRTGPRQGTTDGFRLRAHAIDADAERTDDDQGGL
jgi:hypothetical protein